VRVRLAVVPKQQHHTEHNKTSDWREEQRPFVVPKHPRCDRGCEEEGKYNDEKTLSYPFQDIAEEPYYAGEKSAGPITSTWPRFV
jgi:hypothetical protein